MTEAVYLDNSYLKEIEAEVIKINEKFIVLNKTIFYPKSGGQANDTGTITRLNDNKNFNVVYVGKFGNEISHEVDNLGLQVGNKVLCKLNWERRYKLMRLHTAAHVLDVIFHEDEGVLITGNELNYEKSRIDFNLKEFNKEKIQGYIDKANEIIQKDLEVKNYYLKKEEAMKIPGIVKLASASPPDIPILRITEISGLDIQADGGTHVKHLKEIGKIVFLDMENKGKDRKRIYFDIINE